MISPRAWSGAAVGTLLLALADLARADGDMHRSPHTAESDVLLGAKGALSLEWPLEGAEAQSTPRVGGGAMAYAELSLVPGWLELELGVAAIATEGELALTLEPLAKKNFHVDERIDLYLGVGVVGGVLILPERTVPIAGGLLALGAYLWLSPTIGIDADLTLQLVHAGAPRLELTLGLGPVFRIG